MTKGRVLPPKDVPNAGWDRGGRTGSFPRITELSYRLERLDLVAMSTPRKYAHDDTVRIIETDEIGVVKSFHQDETGYTYGIQLDQEPATEISVREDALELVKIANDGETGFAVSYIS